MADRKVWLSAENLADTFAEIAEFAANGQRIVEENSRLADDLASATKRAEENRTWLREARAKLKGMERELKETRASLHRARAHEQELEKRVDDLQSEVEDLQGKVEGLQSDKAVITRERDEARQEITETESRCRWDLVKDLSPILTKLSALAELEPEPVKGLTSRAVFEKMRDWMSDATGEKLAAFPSRKELGDGLLLDAERDGLDALMEMYDWSPDRPFEGLSEGDRCRKFRVLRRGWRAGDAILAPAKVSPEEND